MSDTPGQSEGRRADSTASAEGVFAAPANRVAALVEMATSGGGDATDGGGPTRGEEGPPDIPGYQIRSRLGEGGMGTVWRAVQISTRREVALKLVSKGAVGSHRARIRFDREVELAARLVHPNIARVYDSGMSRGIYYYAMELVEGRHLDDYIREQGMDRQKVLSLFSDACLAVQHAHQKGVIHRDLKPSNILVTDEGVPKVLDFGLARALDDENEAFALTTEGHWAGTPAFMSPEQGAGDARRIDTRTDVWGLGATLYLLLTGQPPHDTSGPRHLVLRRVVEEDVRRPRRLNRKLGSELEAILLRALARDPERRYESAGALARDIAQYLHGRPVAARPPSPAYILRKWAARNRVAIGVLVLVLAVVGGAGAYVRYLGARYAAATAENRQRGYDEGAAVALANSRAEVFAWAEAARMYDATLASSAASDLEGSGAALVHLALGHVERYRQICQEMLSRKGEHILPGDVALACATRADTVSNWEPVVQLADQALASPTPWRHFLKGMVEYRCGRYKESLPWLDQALRGDNGNVVAPALYYRAMSYYHLGRADDAAETYRQALDCSALMHDKTTSWRNWLQAYFAQSEAEALMGKLAQAQRGRYRRRLGAAPLPGVIEAEDFDDGGEGVGYHDSDGPSFEPGWYYRPCRVGVAQCGDDGGGFSVGRVREGEWLAYTVEVKQGGIHDFEARIASIWEGGQFHLEYYGRDVTGPIDIPRTHHRQAFTTVTRRGIMLPHGVNTFRVVFDRCGTGGDTVCNLNWIAFRLRGTEKATDR